MDHSPAIDPVDRLVEAGYPDRNGIALDEDGNPYLSYFDLGAGTIKVAHKVNGKWVGEIVATKQQHEDCYTAITDAFDVVLRQIEDTLARQRGEVKTHPPFRDNNPRP